MIEVRNLVKSYNAYEVLRDVSFVVGRGEAAAYLGPNGAGKSTTVKIMAGLLAPDAGSVTIAGHDVVAQPIAAKSRLGYVPDDAKLYESLTPAEYLSLVAELYHLPRAVAADRITQMAGAFEIGNVLSRAIETLSRGQRQKVLLIAALLHDPDVVRSKAVIDRLWRIVSERKGSPLRPTHTVSSGGMYAHTLPHCTVYPKG